MSSHLVLGMALSMVSGSAVFLAEKFADYATQKFAKQESSLGFTGVEVVQIILESEGIFNVSIELLSQGNMPQLIGRYNYKLKVIQLAPASYEFKTISAAAISSHECGHVLQDKLGWPLKYLGYRYFILFISLMLFIIVRFTKLPFLSEIAIILFASSFVLSLLTIYVKIDASNRAVNWLYQLSILQRGEENS